MILLNVLYDWFFKEYVSVHKYLGSLAFSKILHIVEEWVPIFNDVSYLKQNKHIDEKVLKFYNISESFRRWIHPLGTSSVSTGRSFLMAQFRLVSFSSLCQISCLYCDYTKTLRYSKTLMLNYGHFTNKHQRIRGLVIFLTILCALNYFEPSLFIILVPSQPGKQGRFLCRSSNGCKHLSSGKTFNVERLTGPKLPRHR